MVRTLFGGFRDQAALKGLKMVAKHFVEVFNRRMERLLGEGISIGQLAYDGEGHVCLVYDLTCVEAEAEASVAG